MVMDYKLKIAPAPNPAIKRAMDIVIATVSLILLSPLLIPVMIILRYTGESLVFFKQHRIGFMNKPFYIWKFVTMLKDSPLTGTITAKNDHRILPFGKFLRKTRINELPQLINVIKGDMSIVGPRPLTHEAFALYPEDLKPFIYLTKPGLTGIGSVRFSDEEYILANSPKERYQCYKEDILPIKGALEIWYAQNNSIVTDIKIIILTAISLILPNNKLYLKWFKDLPIEEN
jgi:lipopolysaccharide/colanic/teichoic acid biosynthesis glycosyltransferase